MEVNNQADADVQDKQQAENQSDSQEAFNVEELSNVDDWNQAIDQLEAFQMPGDDQEAEDDQESYQESQEQSGENENEDGADESSKADENSDESDESKSSESEDESEESEENESSEEEQSPKPKSKRYRVRSEDPVELRAFELKSRNPDMSLKDAMTRAESELGVNQESEEQDGEGDGGNALLKTVQEAEDQIAKLDAERDKALNDELDFERAKELDREIRALERRIGDIKYAEKEQESEKAAEFDAKFDESEAKAVQMYDFLKERGPEVERIEEIDRLLKESGDQLYYSPDKPMKLAQMVAREFGVAPKGKASPKSTGSPPKKKSVVQPAAAESRTQPDSSPSEKIEDKIDSINDPLEWEEMINS